MRVLIVYGTTEGQTRKIAEFAAARLTAHGREVTLRDAAEPAAIPDPAAFDVVLVAASLHAGDYQKAVVDFAAAHQDALNRLPSAFLSVSLSAAGEDSRDWDGLHDCDKRFEQQTGWRPRAVHHAAGAFRFTQYDFFKRLAMKLVAKSHGQQADTSRDYELTDYPEVGQFVERFVMQGEPAAAV